MMAGDYIQDIIKSEVTKNVSKSINTNSIVDYLNKMNRNSSFAARRGLWSRYGFSETYYGTADQNIKLLNRIKLDDRTGASAKEKKAGDLIKESVVKEINKPLVQDIIKTTVTKTVKEDVKPTIDPNVILVSTGTAKERLAKLKIAYEQFRRSNEYLASSDEERRKVEELFIIQSNNILYDFYTKEFMSYAQQREYRTKLLMSKKITELNSFDKYISKMNDFIGLYKEYGRKLHPWREPITGGSLLGGSITKLGARLLLLLGIAIGVTGTAVYFLLFYSASDKNIEQGIKYRDAYKESVKEIEVIKKKIDYGKRKGKAVNYN